MIKVNWKLVNFCEFDKYATKSYCAIHNVSEGLNLGDITKVDETKLADFNCMTWGFPCTDISVAGKQAGFIDADGNKTRSGMYYEGMRILREKKPAISIIENVKNLTGKKFKAEFEQILSDLDAAGYNSYWKVLNAKDYGIPQNRERVFIMSIRKDLDNGLFKFPQGFDNGIRLKDILEDEVDRKYYIDKLRVEELINQIKDGKKGNMPTITNEPLATSALGSREHRCGGWKENVGTLCARDYKDPKCVAIKEATKQGYSEATIGDSINIQFPNSETRRGRVGHEVAQTLETSCNQATLTDDFRIRKLTPKECFRLMGFADEDFNAAQSVGISNSQLYKQAGNSIVVDVLFYILLELYQAMPYLFEDLKLSSFFSGIGAFEKALDRLEEYINKEPEG